MRRWFSAAAVGFVACATSAAPVTAEAPETVCPGEQVIPAYDRSEWGRWRDEDRDCQDTRAEVLVRDSRVPVTFADGEECRVVAGEWVDPYTGAVVTDASLLDIDHRVPLEEAHVSGGWAWDRDRKRAFANDMANLVAAGRSANRSKGSRGPEAWLPAPEETRCPYLELWLATKSTWNLAQDQGEAAVVAYMQVICLEGSVPPLPQGA